MILTIWRHGEAQVGVADRRRELTSSGRDDISYGCRTLHEACSARGISQPDIILHSSLVRATQTAEIIAVAYTHASVSTEVALEPEGDAAAVNTALTLVAKSDSTAEHLVVVSHQPLVSRLVDQYLGERGMVPGPSPGGFVTVSLGLFEPACASLLFWALPPEYEVGI